MQPANGKIITFYSHKGGVGKTTNCEHLACLISQNTTDDKRVLLIDLDPQCNLSTSFGLTPEDLESLDTRSYRDYAFGNQNPIEDHLHRSRYSDKVWLMKGSVDQAIFEEDFSQFLTSAPTDITNNALRASLEFLMSLRRSYNYVLLDLPPAFNRFIRACLALSDLWVISLIPDSFALPTLRTLSGRWGNLNSNTDRTICGMRNILNSRLQLNLPPPSPSSITIVNKSKAGSFNGLSQDVLGIFQRISTYAGPHKLPGSLSIYVVDFLTDNTRAHEQYWPYLYSSYSGNSTAAHNKVTSRAQFEAILSHVL